LLSNSKEYFLRDFEEHIIRTAIDNLEFYKFNNLKKYFPNLDTISNFISSNSYLANVKIKVSGNKNQVENLNNSEKLEITLFVLKEIEKEIKKNATDYKGSEKFKPFKIKEIFTDKILKFEGESERAKGINDILNIGEKEWYAQNNFYGTSEEIDFMDFIDGKIVKLKKEYEDIALVRNEKYFEVYNFPDGKVFEPDFVLFLRKDKKSKVISYQVFIEAKGDQFKDENGLFEKSKEGWKQKFLIELEDNNKIELKLEDKSFKLIGLPFYNEELRRDFEEAFNKALISE